MYETSRRNCALIDRLPLECIAKGTMRIGLCSCIPFIPAAGCAGGWQSNYSSYASRTGPSIRSDQLSTSPRAKRFSTSNRQAGSFWLSPKNVELAQTQPKNQTIQSNSQGVRAPFFLCYYIFGGMFNVLRIAFVAIACRRHFPETAQPPQYSLARFHHDANRFAA